MDANPLLPNGADVVWSVVMLAAAVVVLAGLVTIWLSRMPVRFRLVWTVVVLALPLLGSALWFAWLLVAARQTRRPPSDALN